MAPRRLLEDPPPATDSFEEEESEKEAGEEEIDGSEGEEVEKSVDGEDEEEEEEDEVEEHDEKPSAKKSTENTSSKVSKPQLSSDSAEESGSESESESESESDKTLPSPSASDFTIKPIMSKPMDDSVKPKTNAAKRNLTLVANAGSKRASESDIEAKESKKKKVSNGDDEDVKKGSGVQRLWSEEDEIVILRGMIEYQSKKGSDPYADIGAFHEFIKKNLHVDVSKNQLKDKIRRLKKKYQNNAERGKNGEDPVFSKLHEGKSFELSKKIWGSGATYGVQDSGKSKKKSSSKVKSPLVLASPKQEVTVKKKEVTNGELNAEPESSSNYPFLDRILVSGKLSSLTETATSYMREALPLLGSVKAKELDRKWQKLQEDEFQMYLKRVELFHESAKMLLEAKKSSNS